MLSGTHSGNTHRLAFDDKEIILVGTAHVSKESAALVEQVIQQEGPDTVCVELCEARYKSITDKNRWQETDLLKVVREKRAFVLLMNLILAHFQKKIGQKFGIKPGEEMVRAINAAKGAGARIELADREIRTTLSRTWRLMGKWTKVKLITQLLVSSGELGQIKEEDIEELKKKDVLEMVLSEIGEAMPEIRRVVIDERDQYLAEKIRTAPGKKIVAVVGAGHVPGIQKHWGKAVDMALLEEIPPKSKWSLCFKWGLPALIVALICLGFFTAGAAAGTDMIKWWIMANAILAGLGASLALAHPLTVLSAVAAAPLTSLNPMIAAGWVSGLVETFVGKPKVRDFESLPEDISSMKGFWKNRITRILLVVVFTNLGSSLGTFVAIPLIVKAFA